MEMIPDLDLDHDDIWFVPMGFRLGWQRMSLNAALTRGDSTLERVSAPFSARRYSDAKLAALDAWIHASGRLSASGMADDSEVALVADGCWCESLIHTPIGVPGEHATEIRVYDLLYLMTEYGWGVEDINAAFGVTPASQFVSFTHDCGDRVDGYIVGKPEGGFELD